LSVIDPVSPVGRPGLQIFLLKGLDSGLNGIINKCSSKVPPLMMKSLLQKSGLLVLLAVIGLFAAIVLRGPNGISALTEKRKEIQSLQEVNASLAAENERKRVRIEKLKNNRAEQELEIRDKLKLLRPGETQLIVPEK
jgi:cell division protein FtsB